MSSTAIAVTVSIIVVLAVAGAVVVGVVKRRNARASEKVSKFNSSVSSESPRHRLDDENRKESDTWGGSTTAGAVAVGTVGASTYDDFDSSYTGEESETPKLDALMAEESTWSTYDGEDVSTPETTDSDGDGVPDSYDPAPEDPATVAPEWPTGAPWETQPADPAPAPTYDPPAPVADPPAAPAPSYDPPASSPSPSYDSGSGGGFDSGGSGSF